MSSTGARAVPGAGFTASSVTADGFTIRYFEAGAGELIDPSADSHAITR